MKRVQKSLGVVLAILLMMTTVLAGCGGNKGGDSDPIVGKWTLSSVAIGGSELSLDDLAQMAGEDAAELDVTFDIKADGTFSGDAMGETANGTWAKNGDAYNLTIDGTDQEVKLEDGKLILEVEGMQMILTK